MKHVQSTIFWIIGGALLLRLFGIGYGLPWILVGDEPAFLGGALKMLELKTLIPALHAEAFRPFYYPPLMSYVFLLFFAPALAIQFLISGAQNLQEFRDLIFLNPSVPWLIARSVSAVLGVASVYLIYRISRHLFSRPTGLFAAALLAVSFLHVLLSHFARNWVPGFFFIMLAFWASVRLMRERHFRWYVISALAAGLGFGVSYIPVIGFFFLLFVHFVYFRGDFWTKVRDAKLWKSVAIAGSLAIIFLMLNIQEFFRILIGEDGTVVQPKSFAGFFEMSRYLAKVIFLYDPLILVAGLVGTLLLLRRAWRIGVLSIAYSILYLVFLYTFFHHEARYALFLYPMLLVGAACLFSSMYKLWPRFTTILAAMLLFFPLMVAVQYNFLLLGDTRIAAKNYIEAQLPEGTSLLTNFKEVRITPTRDALLAQQEFDPGSLRKYERALLRRQQEKYPKPRFRALNLHFVEKSALPNDIVSFARQNDYEDVLLQYWHKDNLWKWEKDLLRASKSVARFSGDADGRSRDFNGNVIFPSWSVFEFQRLGPIVELRKLSTD